MKYLNRLVEGAEVPTGLNFRISKIRIFFMLKIAKGDMRFQYCIQLMWRPRLRFYAHTEHYNHTEEQAALKAWYCRPIATPEIDKSE